LIKKKANPNKDQYEENFKGLVRLLDAVLGTEAYTFDGFVKRIEKNLNKPLDPSEYGLQAVKEIVFKLNDNAHVELKMNENHELLITKFIPKPMVQTKSTFKSMSNRMNATQVG
jgi:hypothetical protein